MISRSSPSATDIVIAKNLRWLAEEPFDDGVTSPLADGASDVSIASVWEVAMKTSIGKFTPRNDRLDAHVVAAP